MEEQLNQGDQALHDGGKEQVAHQSVPEDSSSSGLGMLSLKIFAVLVILMIILAFIRDSPITGVFD